MELQYLRSSELRHVAKVTSKICDIRMANIIIVISTITELQAPSMCNYLSEGH